MSVDDDDKLWGTSSSVFIDSTTGILPVSNNMTGVTFTDDTDLQSITLKVDPWELNTQPNGDLEIVFETKDTRKEYHIHNEKIIAFLEKVADLKIEDRGKEDV